MKNLNLFNGKLLRCAIIPAAVLGFMMTDVLFAAPDFIVETPGGQFNYRINGVDGNPEITLVRGHTYTFLVTNTASYHPFAIVDPGSGAAPPGVSGNNSDGITDGVFDFSVPIDATDCIYHCVFHGFGASITIIDPPPSPPVIQIVGLKVGTNLTLTSTLTTTNGVVIFPEFKTNLLTKNWFALTVQTNRFFGGTNEVICGQPPGNQVFIRIRAQQN